MIKVVVTGPSGLKVESLSEHSFIVYNSLTFFDWNPPVLLVFMIRYVAVFFLACLSFSTSMGLIIKGRRPARKILSKQDRIIFLGSKEGFLFLSYCMLFVISLGLGIVSLGLLLQFIRVMNLSAGIIGLIFTIITGGLLGVIPLGVLRFLMNKDNVSK